MRSLRAVFVQLALLAVCAGAGRASAPGFNWVRLPGAETCPAAAELVASIEERLGRSLFVAPSQAQLFVDGSVEVLPGGGFEVRLQVSDRGGRVLGTRSLTFAGDDCSVITAPVAVIVAVTLHSNPALSAEAIALDPALAEQLAELFAEAPVAEPEPEPQPEPEPSFTDADRMRSAAVSGGEALAVNAPFRETLALGVGAGLGFGRLPAANFQLALRATLSLDASWVLELGVDRTFARSLDVRDGLGAVDSGLYEGSLAVCPWSVGLHELRMCAGLILGVIRMTPRDFEGGGAARSDWLANAQLAAVYRPALSERLRGRFALTGAVPFVQRGYTVQGLDGQPVEVFRTAPVTVCAEAGLSFSF